MTKHTIWLHIGTRKTGSSAIQNFLCLNQKKLLGLGFDYPTDFCDGARASMHNALNGMPQCGNLNYIIENWLIGKDLPMSEMLKNFPSIKDKDIILSTENFYFYIYNQKELLEFKKLLLEKNPNHNFKIILYLRRQDELAESMYRQEMKDDNEIDYAFDEKYLEESSFKKTADYKSIADIYAEHFGKKNIIIRPYEKEQLEDNNVLKDFANVLGIKNQEKLNFDINSNPPLDHKITEFLRLAKKHISPEHKFLSSYYAKLNIKTNSPKIELIDPKIKQRALKKYENMNNQLAKDYLGKEKLFKNPPPKTDKKWQPYKLNTEDAVQTASVLMSGMIKDIMNLTITTNNLRNNQKIILNTLAKMQSSSK